MSEFRDILQGSHRFDESTRIIEDLFSELLDVSDLAIGADDPIFDFVRSPRFLEFSTCNLDVFPIVRVDGTLELGFDSLSNF